jgi:hypothetical protein
LLRPFLVDAVIGEAARDGIFLDLTYCDSRESSSGSDQKWSDGICQEEHPLLTDAALKALKPKEKRYKVTDRDGMYVLVTPNGTLS